MKNFIIIVSLLILARNGYAQCGTMLVTGNDTGWSSNIQSTTLAANDVAYTWGVSSPQANEFAIFQTHDPWGYTLVKTAITNAGYTYTVFAPAALTGFPFTNYSVVILNWDDTNVSAFDPPYTSVIPALQAYVLGGGVLWLQAAIQNGGPLTFSLPFGGTGTNDYENDDWIVNPGSSLMTGVANPMVGNYASHTSFTGYPASSQVMDTVGTTPGGATVEYVYQTGVCPPTATPNQTWTPTATWTLTPTLTPSFTPTNTITNTPNLTWTHTSTPTMTPTSTPVPPCDTFYVSKNILSYGQSVSVFVCTSEYPGNLSLNVFNSAGEHIKNLGQADLGAPYQGSFSWDGTNKFGDKCSSGVYVLRLNLPFEVKRARMVWIH